MGFFSKNVNSKVPVAPPIFHKPAEQSMYKMPSSRRLDLHSSSPILGVSFMPEQLTGKSQRRSSYSGAITPVSSAQGPLKPKAEPNKKSNSNHSGDDSYIEEILDEESFYEEEINFEDDYYEEEIIEFVEETKLSERETKITFHEFDEMQTTLHFSDYSAGEMEKSWFCRADYDKMVQKARATAAKLEAKEAKKSKSDKKNKAKERRQKTPSEETSSSNKGKQKKEIDARGLEGWSTEGSQKVRELKEKALEAVWNEQNRQWTTGVIDKEKVRAAYLTVSAGAQAIAEARAAEDRAFVEKNLNKDIKRKKKDKRRMMTKSKSLFGKSRKGGLMSKARKQVTKVGHNNKRLEAQAKEQRQIFRQPSQGSRLLIDHMDDSQSIELSVDDSHGPSKNGDDGQTKRSPRKAKLCRTASWESGMASGKY